MDSNNYTFDDLIFARNDAFGNEPEVDLISGLNQPQCEAVMHKDGPLLILAGAGSGKTKVITHRIANLVENERVAAGSILAITFTNKAAQEMRNRIINLIGNKVQGMWVGTFHSMMLRVLRQHAELLGFSKRLTVADVDDQLKLIKNCMDELNYGDNFQPRAVLATISKAKNNLQSVAAFKKANGNNYFMQAVAEVYSLYMSRLKASDAMDYDDILYYSVYLFANFPEILAIYQNMFTYILVDEYQDTNVAQYHIIRYLSDKHKNLCVVGDDDQSIYSFRGADISNILNFEKDFPQAKIVKLEQNYRSTAQILGAANAIIANNETRKEKSLWTSKADGEKITLNILANQEAEARFVAQEINRLRHQNPQLKYSDFVILYRVNALSRSFEFALRDEAVEYQLYGAVSFFARKEIKDVLAYLRLLANPHDGLAFSRIINVPKRGIGLVTQEAVLNLAAAYQQPPVEICRSAHQFPELERAANRLQKFAGLMDELKFELENAETFAMFIDSTENLTGLKDEIIGQTGKNRDSAEDRLQNLRELISDVVQFENNPLPPDVVVLETENDVTTNWTRRELLDAYLERIALASSADLSTDADAVKLMSIHSAKGLEFPYVFLVGMEEGIFPGFRSLDEKDGLEEERRLAYVAVTRAKQKLFITYVESRLLYGKTNHQTQSRFLKEIPKEFLSVKGYSSNSQRSKSVISTDSEAERHAKSTQAWLNRYRQAVLDNQNDADRANKAAKATVEDEKYLLPKDIEVGMKVEHSRFGVGEVLSVSEISNDAIVNISFAEGKKRMLVLSAKLKSI